MAEISFSLSCYPYDELMATFTAFAFFATVAITIVLTANKDIPILQAFGWIDTGRGTYLTATVLGLVVYLAILQLTSDTMLLDNPPMDWASLIILLYFWICIVYRLRTH